MSNEHGRDYWDLYSGPLGPGVLASNRIMSEVSRGLAAAANNLLAKALRALDEDNEPRATSLIDRASQLPFDEHEQIRPGWWYAHLMLHAIITDVLEGSEDEGWLEAVCEVWDATPAVALDLATILWGYRLEHRLSANELRRVNQRVRQIDYQTLYHQDMAAGGDREVVVIRQVLDAVRAYERAINADPAP